MGFINIGSWELIVLGVAALMIFGPGKLPEVAGQLGKAVRDFRRMTADLTGEFEKTISEVEDVKKDVKKTVGGNVSSMRSQVNSVTSSVKKDLADVSATAGATAKEATGTNGTARRGTTATRAKAKSEAKADGGPVATKADPLADVSSLDDGPTPASGGRIETQAVAAEPTPVEAPVAVADPPVLEAPAARVDSGAPDRADALARARQRRAAAGYNRRQS